MERKSTPHYGAHGTFLQMHHVQENFGRTPVLPHEHEKHAHPGKPMQSRVHLI